MQRDRFLRDGAQVGGNLALFAMSLLAATLRRRGHPRQRHSDAPPPRASSKP